MSAEEARRRGLGCARGVVHAACGYALGLLVALGFAALFVGCAPEPPPRYVVVCLDPTGVVVSCDGEPAPAAGALDAGEAL